MRYKLLLTLAVLVGIAIPIGIINAQYITKVYMGDGGDSQYLVLGGKADYTAGGARYDYVTAVTTSTTFALTTHPSAAFYKIGAANLTIGLPPTKSGALYTFILGADALSAGAGLKIDPDAADSINGNGLTSVDGAYIVDAGSGDREGDLLSLLADGDDGWYIVGVSGTWTKE